MWKLAKSKSSIFKNDDVVKGNILAAHVAETVKRAKEYKVTLAIQDTCYICYNHKKTKGADGEDYKKERGQVFPGKGHLKPHEEELRALRRELTHVRQERDILKKAVAIFSGPQGKGTSL